MKRMSPLQILGMFPKVMKEQVFIYTNVKLFQRTFDICIEMTYHTRIFFEPPTMPPPLIVPLNVNRS